MKPRDLGALARVAAITAHPDDESFGLGGVISALVANGTQVSLTCLTRGEATTLGEHDHIGRRRSDELECAANVLGIEPVRVFEFPDGNLAEVPIQELSDAVAATTLGSQAYLVFDSGGVTGHIDHHVATCAALDAAERRDLPVVGWCIEDRVAKTLNTEFGSEFAGVEKNLADLPLTVERQIQRAAMACHASQLTDNPIPLRRLELQGNREYLRLLRGSFDQCRQINKQHSVDWS